MSRTAVVVTVVAVAVVGLVAAFALGLFGTDGPSEAVATTPSDAATTSADEASTSSQGPTTTAVSTTTAEDPLCTAAQGLSDEVAGHLPVADAEDLQAVRTATVDFYTEAVNHVSGSEQAAFQEVLSYEQELYQWSEANGWEPERSLEDLVDNPPPTPPGEAFAVVSQLLEDRCGITPVRE